MTTKTSTAAQIDTLTRKLADTQHAHDDALAADRAQLAELQARHAAEQAAADQQTAARRKVWADWYLSTQAAAERADLNQTIRQAERDLADTLAAEPWVQALAHVAALRARRGLIAADEADARHTLGLPATADRTTIGDADVLPMFDGELKATPILQAIMRAAQPIADAAVDDDRAARAQAITGHLTGTSSDLDQWQADTARERARNKVAALQANTPADRMETRTHTIDGRQLITHRNLDTGQSITLDADGNTYTPPTTEATTQHEPPTWTNQA